ncbi:hypothetical protein GTZ99_11310 [Novosphingobium sp. FSY-8]|uniref:DUF2147 domain-containing protein n=1 Tax=Novosphingobium ovatum TaxID=1908523 RepID=A0ABW9XF38_9SPHN|nr:hypothetical protein [Novosphingobium ovatum]NBC37146.1 hypothetical protein [Novosphingobium ovatum]
MTALFHAHLAKSMRIAAIALALGGAGMTLSLAGAGTARATPPALPGAASPLFGRWTIKEPKARYTPRAAEYRVIDIAPCGKDFCGVSVGPKGTCGPTLFRFLWKRTQEDWLTGHGRWGDGPKMNLGLSLSEGERPDRPEIYLGLGDKRYQMDSRSSSMPKFDASYVRNGKASCAAR